MLKQSSPTGASQYEFFKSDTGSGLDTRQEFDPLGANLRLNPGPVGHRGGAGDLPGSGGGPSDSRFGDFSNPAAGCVTLLDGVPTFCDFVTRMGNGGGLQLRVGTTKYDIQLLGGSSTLWVDAWEDVYTPGKGTNGYDENGVAKSHDAGTLTTRNVGYFVTIQLSAGTWSPSLASGSGMQQRTAGGSGPQNTSPEERAATRAAEILRDNQDCSNFTVELIALTADLAIKPFNAPATPDFRPILGPSGLEPSFQADDALKVYNAAFRAGRVTASGISGRDGNYTTYGTTTGHNTIAWNREFYQLGLNDQALMTLHESLHLYNNFTDFAIADAAHMLATRNRTSPGTRANFTNRSEASAYINEQIAAHCRP